MSTAEIIAELPRISHHDRRQIMQSIFALENEADLLADCDRRADERFLMLDAMEAEDAQKSAGRSLEDQSWYDSQSPALPDP